MGVLEQKVKRLNEEERDALTKERDMKLRLTHISDELKHKKAEADSSHRRNPWRAAQSVLGSLVGRIYLNQVKIRGSYMYFCTFTGL